MVFVDSVSSARDPQEKTLPLENTQNALPKQRLRNNKIMCFQMQNEIKRK